MHDLDEPFTTEFKSLIYSGSAKEFERKLIERHLEKVSKLVKPWQDKIEALQTLKSMSEKNMQLFSEQLTKSKDGKTFIQFEKTYMQEVSPIVQSLVVAAQNELNQEQELRYANEGIIQIGKEIGEVGSEMITQVAPIKKLDVKVKEKWLNHFQARTEATTNLIKSKVVYVEGKIKFLQAPLK
jgi:hypothetical protein